MRNLAAVFILSAFVAGCELPEITVPPGGTITIVQGVLRPDRVQQWLLVEESYNGTPLIAGTDGSIPSPGGTSSPVQGALVTVTNRANRPLACRSATFLESLAPDQQRAGAYWAPPGCPSMAGGDTLDLLMDGNGTVITASTVIPEVSRIMLSAGGTTTMLPGAPVVFNRDLDTLEAAVQAQSGTSVYYAMREHQPDGSINVMHRIWPVILWSDSTALTLPGDLINFEADVDIDEDEQIPDMFVAGTTYRVGVGFTDRNFWDAHRSGNSPLSGRGFINKLDGGYGYFGSMVAETGEVRVVGDRDDPREGGYRMTGVVDSVNVDLTLDLYLGRLVLPDDTQFRFAAFADGSWVLGGLSQTTRGLIDGNDIAFTISQPTGRTDRDGLPEHDVWFVTGQIPDMGTESLRVQTRNGQLLGMVMLQRVP